MGDSSWCGQSAGKVKVKRAARTGSGVSCSMSDVSRGTSCVTSAYRQDTTTSGYFSSMTSLGGRVAWRGVGSAVSQSSLHDATAGSQTGWAGEGGTLDHDVNTPGLRVWMAEMDKVTAVELTNQGVFHEGASYVVLRVDDSRAASLHCWHGHLSPKKSARTAERWCMDLDDVVMHASILSREVQGHETDLFLRHFSDGIIYVEGRPRTSVSRASQYLKRLYVITGRKFPTAACVEPRTSALTAGGAALLDGFPRLYLWLGQDCHPVTRVKAMRVAQKMRDCQRRGVAHIVVVEGSDTQADAAFRRKLTDDGSVTSDSLTSLATQSTSISVASSCLQHASETPDSVTPDSAQPTSLACRCLYGVRGPSVLYDMPFIASTPLRQRLLVTTDSCLLDQGPDSPLVVWVGEAADRAAMVDALNRGQSFSAHRTYPGWQAVVRVVEGCEPPGFKSAFLEWRERRLHSSQLSRSYSIGNIGRALFSRSDPRTVAKTSTWMESDLTLGSEGNTETFRVDGDSLERSWEQPGVFLNSDCYVIWHRPDRSSQKESCPSNVLFYWLGSGSDSSTQTNCLRLCLTMACALEQAVVIRVLDDWEPQSLFSIFHNSIVVYDQEELSSSGDVTLYCVRECAHGSMRVQQVPALSSSLNSSASYIVLTPSRCMLWFGKSTGGSEREFSKTMLGFLDSQRMYDYEVVTEGREPEFFWKVLGAKEAYKDSFHQPTLQRRQARLCLCTEDNNDVLFQDVLDFNQHDLSENDVFLLDVFDKLFLWCGQDVQEENRKQLLPKYLKAYVATDASARKEEEMEVWIVSQGQEPEAFRRYFRSWGPHDYGGLKAYQLSKKKIRQENAKIDVDIQLVDQTFRQVIHHSYRALLRTELPPDTLQDHREHHLSDKQFREAVKLPRGEFYRLPLCKQDQLLRSAKLAHFMVKPPEK